MGNFISNFDTTAEFAAFSATTAYSEPHVTLIKENNEVRFIEPPETRVVAKFNVTSTSTPTKIANIITGFSAIEIDGVELPSVVSAYTFSTTGEHTVKYTLADPTRIGYNVFYQCVNLTSVYIPNSVTLIINYAFNECSGLTSVTIGNSVTAISTNAFDGCFNLTSIEIPSSVTSIGNYAFWGCSGLTSITCLATTPPTLGSDVFYDTNNCPIYVPSGSVDTYKSASGWSAYASRIQAIS